jgi:hypothetical protein
VSKPNIFSNWKNSLGIVAILGFIALGIYQLVILPGLPEEQYTEVGSGEDKPFEFPSIDSSSCVACHTSEAVIAASDWGKDKPVAENTGG